MRDQVIISKLLINYYRLRKDGDQTLIFLHGWRSEGAVWKNIAQNLKSDGIAIYALDLPGFGSSAIPKEALTIEDYADVVIKFIEKLKLKNIILVGHSFGGRIAIKLSAMHPELIDKLVLVDSAGLILKKNKNAFLKFLSLPIKPFFKPRFMQGLRRKIYRKMGSEDYLATPYLKETYLKTVKEDLRKHFPNIIVPTLIIWGKEDQETPLRYAEIMNNEIKNSKKVILDGAGHFSFIDKPDEFIKEFRDFITS
jgi:pimeloyl-ACP methyl ester carboxylesterase